MLRKLETHSPGLYCRFSKVQAFRKLLPVNRTQKAMSLGAVIPGCRSHNQERVIMIIAIGCRCQQWLKGEEVLRGVPGMPSQNADFAQVLWLAGRIPLDRR